MITAECTSMASACVNNNPSLPPTYSWLSPRISFGRDFTADEKPTGGTPEPDTGNDFLDFEFRLGDSVTMLSADELFSDGKLLAPAAPEIRSPDQVTSPPRADVSGSGSGSILDPHSISPRAPRSSRRWRELLGLRRQRSSKPELEAPAPAVSKIPKSVKHLLKSSPIDSRVPLLRDSDSDVISISSRRSLSSSSTSSGADHDDFPRLSLDSPAPAALAVGGNPPRIRMSRPGAASALAESPRMNASGRVVFEGLERSSSSPGSFNGGPRPRQPGMERRCYSANVRVTPVLNVPVRSVSIFGFGQLFSPQRKERDGSRGGASDRNGKWKMERCLREQVERKNEVKN